MFADHWLRRTAHVTPSRWELAESVGFIIILTIIKANPSWSIESSDSLYFIAPVLCFFLRVIRTFQGKRSASTLVVTKC